jgi:ribose/xylose/arabinose/galactoside ABC-type transport system permease subunit
VTWRGLLLRVVLAVALGVLVGVVNGVVIANHVIDQLRDAGVVP